MIDKICEFIVGKMRNSMPEIDDERADVIKYGVQLIIGEIPKTLILFVLAFLLNIGWYMIFAYIALVAYKTASGGLHLKSHLGCFIGSCIYYYGNIFLSKYIILDGISKYILIILAFIFGVIMISLYAPADTENVPILSKKERKTKKTLSYIFLTITLLVSIFIQDRVLSNILIIGTIIQSIFISRLAYMITKNRYGFEVYSEELNVTNS